MRARRSVAVLIGFALLLAPAAAWAGSRVPAPSGSTGANLIALPLHRVIDTTGTSRREGPGACGDAGNASRLIFRAPANGTLRASTAASSGAFDPVLVVRDDAGRVVACNDDANRATVEANLVARVQRGHQYVLEVAGQAGSTGHTVLAALVAPGARPAVSGSAVITGVVTSSFDGGHINGICVTAYDAFDDAIRDTRTGMNGAYHLEGLPPSHLRVGFAMCPGDPVVYQSQFWKGARDLQHATPIITHNSTVVRGINAALAEFGSIGGTAFDVHGHHPLAGICVSAQSAISHALLQAITSVTGTYRIQVTTSAYQIQGSFADWWTVGFHDCTTAIEADQWYDGSAAGAATPAGAHPIHLDLGQAVTGIDAIMHAGGGITGTVRSLATGATQPGDCVDASSPGRPDHEVTTDSSGRYRLGGLTPGSYYVLFTDCAHHKLSAEYWQKAGSRATALAVHVTANQNTPNINANLSATGAIAGTVVDEKTHKPLGAVCVSAQGDDFGSAKTNAHGQFRISGLSFGPHLVLLRDCGSGRVFAYLPTYYDHSLTSSAATPVVVKPGATTTITASLIRSGGIEGVVTGAARHKPLVGVCVVLELPHSTTPVGFARTSVTGAYRIVAAPGSYDVQFSGCPGPSYLKQYWQGAADQHHATPVTVGASHDVTGIDAGLTVGATIAGHVFYYDGNFGLSDTCAQARTGPSPGKVIEEAPTNYDGSYALSGLPAGRYRVELGHCSGQLDFFAPTFAFDSPSYDDATVFTVSGGQLIQGVDGNIDFGGSIQGTVRDSAGKGPVNGVCVEAVGSDPDAVPQVTETYYDGSFYLGNLPPDTYHIRFGGHPSLPFDYFCHDTEVAQSWYPAALDQSTSKGITLTVHQNRLGINGTVFAPAQVTGFVTASTTGKPVAVPCATAYGSSGQLRGRPAQIAVGLYAVFDLPPDTYRVRIADCGHSGLAPQFYKGAADLKHATPIPLEAGQVRSDIGATLHQKAFVILDRFKLTDRVAIVTGAGKGIGAGTARALAEAGADVVVAARTVADIEATAAAVRERGRRSLAVPCDVTQTADLEHLVAATVAEFGRIDVLVNNAGGWLPRPMMATSEKAFEAAHRFNVTAPFVLIRLAVPAMIENDGGAIVNISSRAGSMVQSGFTAYGTAKAGLSFMTRLAAPELAPKVRINAIEVGGVETSALEMVLTDESVRRELEDNTPMRRVGQVEDIAACVVYLASPAASWVTGKVFEIDGGVEHPAFTIPVPEL